jgi:Ala-tRNA(Pro) deacylase
MLTLHEVPTTICDYLESEAVLYERIRHERDCCSQEAAAHSHTPGHCFAKCMLLRMHDEMALLVMPADHRIDFKALAAELKCEDVRLAHEEDMARVFPDCEVGAEPPLGLLYDIPVYVSAAITTAPFVTFNAGTHEEALRISYEDFERINKAPRVIDCTEKVTTE